MYYSSYAKVLRYAGSFLPHHEVVALSSQPEILADRMEDVDDPRGTVLRKFLNNKNYYYQSYLDDSIPFYFGDHSLRVNVVRAPKINSPKQVSVSWFAPETQRLDYHPELKKHFDEDPLIEAYFTPEEALHLAQKFPDKNRSEVEQMIYKHFPHLKPQGADPTTNNDNH